VDEASKSAIIIAPDNQLSLAIGRRGQNVRLAAQLTGWHIDIRSETQWHTEKQAPAVAKAEVAAAAAPVVEAVVAEGAEVAEEVVAAPVETKKIRIYELATELGVEVKDLVEILQDEGIQVTSHASSVTQEQAAMVREMLMGGAGTLEEMEPADTGADQ
jgi:N utilization substance protein A